MRRSVFAAALLALFCRVASGQGGAPMLTDDPATAGRGHWQINLAVALALQPDGRLFIPPGLDLTYGLTDQVDLNLLAGPVALQHSEDAWVGGFGGTELAVKWRFLDEEKCGVAVSVVPRLIFNLTQASARRGLAPDGTRFQVPFQVAKTFGRYHADVEIGPLASSVGASEWLYGVVGGVELSPRTMVMAELHGNARTDFAHDVLAVNVGLLQSLSEQTRLIASLGHELRNADDPRALIGYLGVQLNY